MARAADCALPPVEPPRNFNDDFLASHRLRRLARLFVAFLCNTTDSVVIGRVRCVRALVVGDGGASFRAPRCAALPCHCAASAPDCVLATHMP